MKKNAKYKIILILFTIVMLFIVYFFAFKYNDIILVNRGKVLLKQLYELQSGTYSYKDGLIFNEKNSYYSDNYKINGSGKIEIDKYGNVRYYIDTNNMCVYKMSTDNVKFLKNKCKEFDNLVVELIKNNNKISFTSLIDNLEYKISSKDDFNGEWIKKSYTGNLVIDNYKDGDNYIWFRDKEGNISDVIKFRVDCLNTNGAIYNSDIFYCTGSTVIVDNIEWIVIKDDINEISLMMKNSLDEKMSHCTGDISNFCYYTNESYFSYKWSNSFVNNYLNNEFIDELSDKTKSNLITKYICDEYDNVGCDDFSCGGYKREIIEYNKWSCVDYSSSRVRIISFDEYNYLYNKLSENSLINGSYLMINSLNENKASIVDSDYSVYIMEDLLVKNKIRPVITLKK